MTDEITTEAKAASYVEQKRDELLEKLREIDRKYSTEYQDPELNLPESLGLEKMTFTMPDAEQLTKRARESIIADYTDKKYDIQEEARQQTFNAEQEKEQINFDADEDIQQLNEQYCEDRKKCCADALDQGIFTSSVYQAKLRQLADQLKQSIAAVEAQRTQKLQQLTDQLTQIADNMQQQLANLDEVFEHQLQEAINEWTDEAYKQQQTVLKYNNTVQEKEQEYVLTREKTTFNAFMDEASRAIEASNLIANIGYTALSMLIKQEKTDLCKKFFGETGKANALAIIDICPELQGHTGEYYAYLLDYVENME